MYIQNRNYKAAFQNAFTTPLCHGQCARCKALVSHWQKGNSSHRQLVNRHQVKGKPEGQWGVQGQESSSGNWSSAATPHIHSLPTHLSHWLPTSPMFQCGFDLSFLTRCARLTLDCFLHDFILVCTQGISKVRLGPLAV